MAKILITVHLGRHFNRFGQSDMEVLLKMGHEVHIAANFSDSIDNYYNRNVHIHQIDFDRNPLSIRNITAYQQLKNLFEKEKFNYIHTQSPTGGVITRLVTKRIKKKGIPIKVLYTAHGFHFFKGSSVINWLIYFPIEKYLSNHTDCCITMNNEDYNNAKNKMRYKKVFKINGVGVDNEKFCPIITDNNVNCTIREELGLDKEDFVALYVAELSKRKNQIFLLESLSKIDPKLLSRIKILLAGEGPLKNKLLEEIKQNGLEQNVLLLGYRNDVNLLMKISDLYICTSKQEGLPLNVIEAMSSGLPILATNIRGNNDLVNNNINGFLINNQSEFIEKIENLLLDPSICKAFSDKSLKLSKQYSVNIVEKQMREIYLDFFHD